MGGYFLHPQGLIDAENQIFIPTTVPTEQGTANFAKLVLGTGILSLLN
jgi:hypothetical protein